MLFLHRAARLFCLDVQRDTIHEGLLWDCNVGHNPDYSHKTRGQVGFLCCLSNRYLERCVDKYPEAVCRLVKEQRGVLQECMLGTDWGVGWTGSGVAQRRCVCSLQNRDIPPRVSLALTQEHFLRGYGN